MKLSDTLVQIETSQNNSHSCIICLGAIEHSVITYCLHWQFCLPCLRKNFMYSSHCPFCKTFLDPSLDYYPLPILEDFDNLYKTNYKRSSKIQKIIEILHDTKYTKAVIFSHFISMLELLRRDLKSCKFPILYIDGSTPSDKRDQIINKFKFSSKKEILLISIKVGGFGLNLTEADLAILVEPWWNPAIEDQAIDRINRIGQNVYS